MIRLAFLETAANSLSEHFAASAPVEEGAFCLLSWGRGARGIRLLVTEVILPPPGVWEVQDAARLRPSAQWISAAVSRAIEARAGLLFIHSHPDPHFPTSFSPSDLYAFENLARTLAPLLDGPFAAVVAHPHGWSGVVWAGVSLKPIDRIFSVGRTLRFLSSVPRSEDSELDRRQRDALGVVQDRLRVASIGVVGCGGLGSPAAEQLVRMGVGEVVLIDYDFLDTLSNVRRVFGSRMSDLQRRPPSAKVRVVGRHLKGMGLSVPVRLVRGDVRTESVFRELLDTDVVLMGTDTHGSRAVVNDLASAYLLPVIDTGVRVGSRAGGILCGLLAEVRVLTPVTPCLWCRRAIDGDVIRTENLPEDERKRLQREGYVVHGVGDPAPSVVALTTLGSGLMTCALLGLLAEEGDVAPHGYWLDGFLGDSHEVGPAEPLSDCWCRSRLGKGDAAAPPLLPRRPRERLARAVPQRKPERTERRGFRG